MNPTIFHTWYVLQQEHELSSLLHSCMLMQQSVEDQVCEGEAENPSCFAQHLVQLQVSDFNGFQNLLADSGGMEDEVSVVRAGSLLFLVVTHDGESNICVGQWRLVL